jgi:DNA-binding NarL/FixJ family response regulator
VLTSFPHPIGAVRDPEDTGEQADSEVFYHFICHPARELEAFKAAPDSHDLVITDMSMPNLTGDRLARELVAIRPDIPVIICTGFSERMNPDRADAMGIKGFLMKPVVYSELAALVRKVLDEAKSQGQEGSVHP